jgi:Flp pilus assembly protein TadD
MAGDDADRLVQTQAACARFMDAYLAQSFEPAVDIFLEALTADPDGAFRHFATFATGQLSQALIASNRTDEVVARLDAMLADHPHMHLICDEDPDKITHLLATREKNIRNGLPSVVVAAMGKSASTTIGNIFHSGFDLPTFAYSLFHMQVIDSWARDFARGGASYTTHLDPSRDTIARLKSAGISRIIVHVRDPRQALVSLVHHFDKYPDQLVVHRERVKDAPNMSARAMAVLDLYSSSIGWIRGWLDLDQEIDILFSTFEEFVTDRTAFVGKYLEFYGVDRGFFSWEEAFGEHTGVDEHFRSGRTDEWREVFSPEEAEYLSSMMPLRAKERFGWWDPEERKSQRSGELSRPSPRDRVAAWLKQVGEPGDAAAREEVERRVAAAGGPTRHPPGAEEAALRAGLRDYPDHTGMLMRMWRLIEDRGGQVPDGLAIHALRSRLAELSRPTADGESDVRERERSEIERELTILEVLEQRANGGSAADLLLSGRTKFADAQGYSKLARELTRCQDLDAAEAAYLLAIELNPSSHSLHRALADVIDANGRSKEAMEILQLLAAQAPRDAELQARLGHVLIRGGDLGRAEAALRVATALDGAPVAAWCDLADVLAERGRSSDAIALLQGRVAQGLRDAQLDARLGLLMQRHGDRATAG